MTEDLLWPDCATPGDLATIEAVPLEERGLPESTYALLTRAATRWPDRTAISVLPDAARWREPLRRSFAELLADVHRNANLLHDLGVRRGDAVALMSPNCAELITATLAAQLAGIAAPLGSGLSRQHLAELLRRSGARVLVTAGPELAPDIWDTAQDLAREGRLDALLALRPTGAAGAPEPLPALDGVRIGYLGELAAAKDPSAFDGDPPRSSDLAALFHTGGTTGAPKLAAHTHANEVADAWMMAASSLFDSETVVFAALPLFHVNALVVTLLAPLFKGQHVVWAGPLGYRDPALYGEFWKIVEHYRIAAMSAVPTVYGALAQRPVDADISSLRHPMVGASPLPAAVRDGFQTRTGTTLVEGYGLTEATCASALTLPRVRRPGSVGQRLPYQRMRAVRVAADGTWTDVPVGETGVLAISGPTVFPGYVTGRDRERPRPRRPRQAARRLAGHRRPGPHRRGRLRLPRRPGQGPHHPRRAQHRPRHRRGRAAGSPAGHRGQRGRAPRRARRRGPRRLRHPRPRRHGDRGRPARLGEPAGARPHRRTEDRDGPRRAAPHRRGQALQARAADRRHPQGTARRARHDRRGARRRSHIEGSSIVAVVNVSAVRRRGRHQGDRRPLRHRIPTGDLS